MAECQKEDWQNHNSACRFLKGGTWRTISVKHPATLQFLQLVNRLDDISTGNVDVDVSPHSKPLENIHNGKNFLANFQISLAPQSTDMMIDDRQRSFQVHWRRNSDINLFDYATEVMGSK